MADVSYHNLHGDDDENDDVLVSFSPHTNTWSQDLDGFDVCPSDLDFPSSEHFLCRHRRRRDPNQFDRENQVTFLIDMFHQRVEQSHSSSRVIVDNDLVNSDRSFGFIENDLEMDFGSRLGLGLGFRNHNRDDNDNDDDNSGFMVADCGDEFFLSSRAHGGARSESGYSSSGSGGQVYFMGGLSVTDSDEAGENEIIGVDDDFGINGGCDDEANLRLCWDAFHLDDDDHPNEDFEWEEVDGRIDEREVLNTFLDADADNYASVIPPSGQQFEHEELGEDQTDALQWEVLLNVHNLEANPDLAGQFDEDEYNEMFFGQFSDNVNSALVRPPASKRGIESLPSVIITLEDDENDNTICAVCKDEIGVGEMAKQLPCRHRYHGECIIPWLCIQNTCPVCRHELPTDDPEYERIKTERVASTQ